MRRISLMQYLYTDKKYTGKKLQADFKQLKHTAQALPILRADIVWGKIIIILVERKCIMIAVAGKAILILLYRIRTLWPYL